LPQIKNFFSIKLNPISHEKTLLYSGLVANLFSSTIANQTNAESLTLAVNAGTNAAIQSYASHPSHI